jgi:2-polyprenyl-6-methoxyphenol hydroxylase-like FAD-dependent oxidoreductase
VRVVIVGAGLGGLCLAHGLRGAGVDVVILEREPSLGAHRQGYRLNLNHIGAAGLARCLPERLCAAYRATAHHQTKPAVTLRTIDGSVIQSRRVDAEHAVAVDRSTLRRVLLTGLDDVVRFGHAVDRVEPDSQGVRVLGADGTVTTADLVVGADGPGSVIREMLAPGTGPRPSGVRGIYGRTPLDAPACLRPLASEARRSRFTGLSDLAGTTLALGAWQPVEDPALVGQRIGIALTDARPYMMWALLSTESMPTGGNPAVLRRHAMGLLAGWADDARQLVDAATVADTFALTIRAADAVPTWTPGPVTLLGDAAHAMSPAGGEGANTALGDAALLTEALTAHVRGEISLLDAIAGYDCDLRRFGNTVLARSANYSAASNTHTSASSRPQREDLPA